MNIRLLILQFGGLFILLPSTMLFLIRLEEVRGLPGPALPLGAGLLVVNTILCFGYLISKRSTRWLLPAWFSVNAVMMGCTAFASGHPLHWIFCGCFAILLWQTTFSSRAELPFLTRPWSLFRDHEGHLRLSLDTILEKFSDEADDELIISMDKLSDRQFKAAASLLNLRRRLPLLRTFRKHGFRIHAVKPDRPLRPGSSKFGGLPDLPSGFSWPYKGDEPLEFFAQINLSDLPEGPVVPSLPSAGMLCFFGSQPDWDLAPGDGVSPLAYYFPPSTPLTPAHPPQNYDPVVFRGEAGLSFTVEFTVAPSHFIEERTKLFSADEAEALEFWMEHTDEHQSSNVQHQLLGFPMRFYAHDSGVGPEDPVLLLQIATDKALDFGFPNTGLFNFMMPPGAVEAGQWERCSHSIVI